MLFDIEYDIVGASCENVDGEKVNENDCDTTANGGTCAFKGNCNRGIACTSDIDPKMSVEKLRKKVMFIRMNLQSATCRSRFYGSQRSYSWMNKWIIVDMLSIQGAANKPRLQKGQ